MSMLYNEVGLPSKAKRLLAQRPAELDTPDFGVPITKNSIIHCDVCNINSPRINWPQHISSSVHKENSKHLLGKQQKYAPVAVGHIGIDFNDNTIEQQAVTFDLAVPEEHSWVNDIRLTLEEWGRALLSQNAWADSASLTEIPTKWEYAFPEEV